MQWTAVLIPEALAAGGGSLLALLPFDWEVRLQAVTWCVCEALRTVSTVLPSDLEQSRAVT